MTACPTEEELIFLLDGEATVNAAERTRAHLAGCPRCRRTWRALEEIASGLRAPLPAVDAPRLVAGVMYRIEHDLQPRPPPQLFRRRAVVAVTVVAAIAAGIALAAIPRGHAPSVEGDGVFASRGGAPLSLRQAVVVTFRREGATLDRLASGEVVAKDAKLTVSYRNAREREPAYLLAFAVDAEHAVHWLFPAYERAGENPASATLAPSAGESPMGTSVVLDQPSSGPVRLVALVSSAPRHVADIESLPRASLSLAALRARFPDDVIEETSVSFP
jgi:hypothetical protein